MIASVQKLAILVLKLTYLIRSKCRYRQIFHRVSGRLNFNVRIKTSNF